jgi:hypothetical protein
MGGQGERERDRETEREKGRKKRGRKREGGKHREAEREREREKRGEREYRGGEPRQRPRAGQARSATARTRAAVPHPLLIKSPSSVPLVCTGSHRNPATCGTNQDARKRRFGPALRRTGKIRQSADTCSRAAPPPAADQNVFSNCLD